MPNISEVYTFIANGDTYTTAITMLEVTLPTARAGSLMYAHVTQDASVTSAQEVVDIVRKTAAGTGTAVTGRNLNENGAGFPAGGASRRNMSAEGTVGDILWRESFNVLNGFKFDPKPELYIPIAENGIIGIRWPSAPASITPDVMLVIGLH
jgi:hypothetical protein